MSVTDVYSAKLTEEIGLASAAVYTEAERRAVATHEAGHATAAHLLGIGRRLEVLSIVKRRASTFVAPGALSGRASVAPWHRLRLDRGVNHEVDETHKRRDVRAGPEK